MKDNFKKPMPKQTKLQPKPSPKAGA